MNGLQKKIILRALDAPEELTEWEVDFISDMAGRDDTYSVSVNQNKVLNRIWEKLDQAGCA